MSNQILDATVAIKIDTSTIDKQLAKTSAKVEAALQKANIKASNALTKQIDRGIGKVGKDLEKGADKLSKVLEKGLKFGLGLGATAIYAFLKSGTPEALKFSNSLDRVKMAWAKVGQTVATKIKFGGFTGQELLDKLVNKLENLDTSQIQKIVNGFKAIAGIWATIKIAQGINELYKFGQNAKSIYDNLNTRNNIGKQSVESSSSASAFSNLPLLPGVSKKAASKISNISLSDLNAARNIQDNNVKLAEKTHLDSVAKRIAAVEKLRAVENRIQDRINKGKDGDFSKSYKFDDRALEAGSIEKIAKERLTEQKIKAAKIKTAIDVKNTQIRNIEETYKAEEVAIKRNAKLQKGLNAGAFALAGIGAATNIASALGDKNISSTERQRKISGSVAGLSVAALGTALGGPIGTAIGYAVGEGLNSLTNTLVDILQPSLRGTFKAGEGEEEEYRRRLKFLAAGGKASDFVSRADIFSRTDKSKKAAQEFSKKVESTSSKYVEDIPLSERKKLMPDAIKNINLQTSSIKELQGMQQTDTVKQQRAELEKARAELLSFVKDTVSLNDKEIEAKKAHVENLEKFDKSIKEAQEKDTKAKEEDTKAKDKLLQETKTAPGRISMGGDITSIPQIISESFQDADNSKFEALQESVDRQLEIAELDLKLKEEQAERDKEILELQKEVAKEDKDYHDKDLKNGQTLNSSLGQSGLTAINEF